MSIRPRLRFFLPSLGLGLIALHLVVFWLVRREAVAGAPDFRIFYTAGLMLRRGQGQSLYKDELQAQTQQEVAPKAFTDQGLLPYNHPPFEAILYVGLTYIPYLRAYFCWMLLNVGLLAATVYIARPWLPTLCESFPELLFLTPLAFFPAAYALMQGQDSVLLLALYVLAYAAFRRRQDLRAGVCLGLGLFKFHLVLPFAFVLLLGRRWRALCGLLLTAAFDVAISWALVGWREFLYYPRYAWLINRQQPTRVIVPRNMPNLRGLFTGWPGLAPAPPWLAVLLFAASLGLLIWASRQWKPGDLENTHAWNTGFSIVVLATFLVGYHSYNQDMSILLLPVLLTLDRVLQGNSHEQDTRLRVALGLMFFSPLYLVLTLHYEHQNLFSLVLLGFVACLAKSLATVPPSATANRDLLSLTVPAR
jgi:hypothetical protein